MTYQSEAALEQQFMEQLNRQGYSTVDVPDYDALVVNFKAQFEAFNAPKLDAPITEKEWERILNLMRGKSVFQSAKILRDKFVLEREDGTKVYLSFFDPDHSRNIFQITHQTTVTGKYVNRYDVTILINGLPLIQVELKRRGCDIREAVNQVMRYKKHSYNGLYHFIQLFIVSNGVDTKYFANSDKDLLYSFAFFWTNAQNFRLTRLDDFSRTFLERAHIIKMITRYTILNETDRILMIMRPYQVYAVEALIKQAERPERNAYIWHTTGAGKTLTSFKTAQILATHPNIKKVIFLVDRKDLDTQTTEEFNKFEAGSVDVTDRTDVLVRQMKDKNRQLIVTTIQKMANAVKRAQYEKIMDAYRDEKVVFIIDECHRSQFGDMHKDIVRHFKKAQFFGFTGTPRFDINGKTEGKIIQTTEMLFGECLHNYRINHAIFDHNVLGFQIEYVKTMEGNFDDNDPTLADAIDIDELYMSDERMSLIAHHIAQHHASKTRNKQYTAIFAVSSIEALVKYYDLFKTFKHDLNISGIFSYGQNEDAECKDEHSRDALERIIKDYNDRYDTNFSTETFAAYHKDISDRVKGKKTPPLDILLVVNMFLTGFDSKTLSVLYVDKNLKYHDLLQAYSRTNRVEKETKPFGIIVCYRNLKKNTDDALALFSQNHSSKGIVIPEYDDFVRQFHTMVDKLHSIAATPEDVDTMPNEDAQKNFVVTFRELTKYLQSLQTFIEFSFDPAVLKMSEQEYQDYKSKYLMLYSKQKRDRHVESVLNDVDFCIEIMESDRINVAYIMNLLRNIHFDDIKRKNNDIQQIKENLKKTDNPQLMRKVELLQAFLERVVVGLENADDIDAAYNDFENEMKKEEIRAFAQAEDIDAAVLEDFISEYEFSGTMDAGLIRDCIEKPLSLIQKRTIVNQIVHFIQQHTEKYQ